MSDIVIAGNTYTNVPQIIVPKVGGGSTLFTDVSATTAAATDVASGKIFYNASGIQTIGTASGGGGGSNKLVEGTFTTGTKSGGMEVDIAYTGDSYPIGLIVAVDGGLYANTTLYNTVKRYAVVYWSMSKADTSTAPNYNQTAGVDYGTITGMYKSSNSYATTLSSTATTIVTAYDSTGPSNSASNVVKFISKNKIKVYVIGNSNYGFFQSTTYRYWVIYK